MRVAAARPRPEKKQHLFLISQKPSNPRLKLFCHLFSGSINWTEKSDFKVCSYYAPQPLKRIDLTTNFLYSRNFIHRRKDFFPTFSYFFLPSSSFLLSPLFSRLSEVTKSASTCFTSSLFEKDSPVVVASLKGLRILSGSG